MSVRCRRSCERSEIGALRAPWEKRIEVKLLGNATHKTRAPRAATNAFDRPHHVPDATCHEYLRGGPWGQTGVDGGQRWEGRRGAGEAGSGGRKGGSFRFYSHRRLDPERTRRTCCQNGPRYPIPRMIPHGWQACAPPNRTLSVTMRARWHEVVQGPRADMDANNCTGITYLLQSTPATSALRYSRMLLKIPCARRQPCARFLPLDQGTL